MDFELVIYVLIAIILSLGLTPLVIRLAPRLGAMDIPDKRKVHARPVPRLGGIGVYVSFFVTMVLIVVFGPDHFRDEWTNPRGLVLFFVSLSFVVAIGIWDDIRPLSAGKKFIGQWVAASVVYFAGFKITAITHPFSPTLLELGIFSYLFTVLWIVGICNAINLIDGLDGLASGIGLIASLTIFSISLIKDEHATMIMAMLISGAIMGFLPYNFQNARIFLGDSGSLFIGFTLAILSMQSSTKGSTVFSMMVPMLALGLPIMDTLLSMLRRFLNAILPEGDSPDSLKGKVYSMFHPDKGHIHHKLLAMGLSHKKAVLIMYVISCVFGVGAFVVTFANNFTASIVIIAIAVATIAGVRLLKYREIAIFRNGVLLPIYNIQLFRRGLFLSFLDLGFMIAAAVLAYKLAFRNIEPPLQWNMFLTALALLSGIQITSFLLSGMYSVSRIHVGLRDAVKIVNSVVVTVSVTFAAFYISPSHRPLVDVGFILFDFFFLLTFVVGTRGSFRVLSFFWQRDRMKECTKVLIYGADRSGVDLLRKFLEDDSLNYCPVGFLDDDPGLEGQKLEGFPIFGGHWKLLRLVRKFDVREVIIAAGTVNPTVYSRLFSLCRDYGISLRRSSVRLEDCEPTPPKPPVEEVVIQQSFSFSAD